MNGAIILVGGALMFGGVIAAFAGHVWEKTAHLLRLFGKDLTEEAGFKVMACGLAAFSAGCGLLGLVHLFGSGP